MNAYQATIAFERNAHSYSVTIEYLVDALQTFQHRTVAVDRSGGGSDIYCYAVQAQWLNPKS